MAEWDIFYKPFFSTPMQQGSKTQQQKNQSKLLDLEKCLLLLLGEEDCTNVNYEHLMGKP